MGSFLTAHILSFTMSEDGQQPTTVHIDDIITFLSTRPHSAAQEHQSANTLPGQQDKRELDRVFSGITQHRFPTWLISFSEATRFTPQKHLEMQQWCEANGRPQPRHLLYPRTRGFIATVQHVRGAAHVKAVYDLTIAYRRGNRFQQAPPFWDTIRYGGLSSGCGGGYRFEVHLRRFAMEDLPMEDAQLAKWLETRWVEKGEWLERKRLEWEAEDGVR